MTGDRPNILLIVSDEERRNDWLPAESAMPAHDRLRDRGLELTRHYTHTSPCSPSRASLYSGRYLPGHAVVDNVNTSAYIRIPFTLSRSSIAVKGPLRLR